MSDESAKGDVTDAIRQRRLERAENARTATEDRGLEPFYATGGAMVVTVGDGPTLHEGCGIAAMRPPWDNDGEYIALIASTELVPDVEPAAASIVLRRDDLRNLLKLLSGKAVKPAAIEALQVGVLDLGELERGEKP